MTSNTQIKVQIVADQQSAQAAKRQIAEITNEVMGLIRASNQLNSAMLGGQGGGLGGVGLTGQTGATPQSALARSPLGALGQKLSKPLSDQALMVKVIAKASKESLVAMSSELKTNLDKQTRLIDTQTARVQKLAKAYAKLKEKQAQATAAGDVEGAASLNKLATKTHDKMVAGDVRRGRSSGRLEDLQERERLIGDKLDGGGDGRGGGGRNYANYAAGGMAVSAVGSSVSQIGGLIQLGKTMEEGNLAYLNQSTRGRFLGEMLRGDLRSTYAMQNLTGLNGKSVGKNMVDGDWSGKGALIAETAGTVMSGVGDTVGGAAGIGAATAKGDVNGIIVGAHTAADGATRATKAIQGAYKGAWEVGENQSAMAGLDASLAMHPALTHAMDLLQQEKYMRADAARKLQGQHMEFRPLGAERGFTFGQSLGIGESLHRSNGMTGLLGDYRALSKEESGSIDKLYAEQRLAYKRFDPSSEDKDAQNRHQYEIEQTRRANKIAEIKEGTKIGVGRTETVMDLMNYGFDQSVSSRVIENGFAALGGRSGDGQKMSDAIDRIRSRAFVDHRISGSREQEELLAALGDATQGQAVSGSQGMEHLGNFLTLGADNTSVEGMRARRQNLGFVDNLYHNNPFFQGTAMAGAMKRLGRGSEIGAQIALSGASMSQLLVGTKQMEHYGISEDARMGQAKDNFQTIFRAYAGQTDRGALEALKNAKGDFRKIPQDMISRVMASVDGVSGPMAEEMGKMLHESGDIGNFTEAQKVKWGKMEDKAAASSIRVEEMTKDQLYKVFDDVLGRHMDKLDTAAIVTAINNMSATEASKENKELAVGRKYIVSVQSEWNDKAKVLPPNPRDTGQSKVVGPVDINGTTPAR